MATLYNSRLKKEEHLLFTERLLQINGKEKACIAPNTGQLRELTDILRVKCAIMWIEGAASSFSKFS